ncbi:MAG: tRNA pseudouridine(38-40) synthase TruA [Eubacteriales bacterium]|nr:tRNA pseudouridine(38-40) synthase TruA [Eubacteriales bacterium]
MKNYRFIIEYDGSRYNGWQRLKENDNTIQGKLEKVLSLMTGTEVRIIGSGRTDAGVHARGQIANAVMDTRLTTQEIKAYMNRYLPDDIRVNSVDIVSDRFHSRYNASRKTYTYYISTSEKSSVFKRKYLYSYGEKLDIEAMKEASRFLIGEHDFKSFCGNRHMKKSTIRNIYEIDIRYDENEGVVSISYTGDGFLQYMIRIMTGTLIETGRGDRKPEDIVQILDKKDRQYAGYTVPPGGLFLEKVSFD